MKQIKIISASQKVNESETDLYKSVTTFSSFIKFYVNNKTGLSEIYNKELTDENKGKILVYCHDDVTILANELYFIDTLNKALQEYDIVGLAGTIGPITLKSPTAWHLVSPRETHRGCVYHQKDDKVWATSFGLMPVRALLIDGVFIAINTKKILEAGLKFDEQFKFHHYDLDFCLAANKLKLKVGVINIPIIHRGLGDSMFSNDWKESDKRFIQKWA